MRTGLLLVSLLVGACSTSTRVRVKSLPETNDGRSFYVMVREVEGDDLVVGEGYDAAASALFSRAPDPSIRDKQVILPGTDVDVDIEVPPEKDLALYFFFTRPGDRWWLSIDKQQLPALIEVELGLNEVERLRIKER